MYLTIRAVVLRVTDYNDRDSLLTVLTEKHGKLTIKARGLRRKNSPLIASCQLLAYAEFTLFEYRGQYTINEAHSIELFTPLRRELSKLSLGTYFAQVTEAISAEDLPNPQLQALLLNCLFALSKLDLSETLVKSVFELRSACLAGYTPDLFTCHICGSTAADRFDVTEGQLTCTACRNASANANSVPVTEAMLDAMRYICQCEPKKLFLFSLGESNLLRLSDLTERFLLAQLERGFSTLDFYKSLEISWKS